MSAIGFVFDAWQGCGLGHLARTRGLLREALRARPGLQARLVPLSMGGAEAIPLGELCPDLLPHLAGPPSGGDLVDGLDALVVDSYRPDILELGWLDSALARRPALRCAIVADERWPGLDARAGRGIVAALDGTYALEGGLPGGIEWIAGPAAIFLNDDVCVPACAATAAYPHAACRALSPILSLGMSEAGRAAAPEVERHFAERHGLDLSPVAAAGRYGAVRVRGEPDTLTVGDCLAHAEELVIAVGQTLWEAARARPIFWAVCLSPLHAAILERLDRHGVIRIAASETAGRWELKRVRIPGETARRLADQRARATGFFSILLGESGARGERRAV